jgi:hypothetical protein
VNVFGYDITRRRADQLDTSRPGWRERFTDMVMAARGKAGLRSGTQRETPAQMAEYYAFLPKLSFLQIKGLAYSWMQGNFAAGYDLVSIVLDTWPTALKDQHECRSTMSRTKLTAYPFKIGDAEATTSAIEKCDFINGIMETFKPTPGTDERGWRGTLYGLGGAIVMPNIREVLYEFSGKDIHPYATVWANPRTYGFINETLDNGREITRLAARVGKSALPQLGYATPPTDSMEYLRRETSLVGIYDTRDGASTMSGLMRPLLWWWGGMMYGRDWLMRYAEMFGQPLRVAYYDPNIPPNDLAELKAMLGNMGASAWAAVRDDVRKMEFYEGKGTGPENPQRFMIEHGDKYCDLLFHGETMTSRAEQGTGGQMRGSARENQKTRTEREEDYAAWIAETVREQLVRQCLIANFGNDDECPRIAPDYTTTPDALQQAQVLDIMLDHFDISADDASEITGLPLVDKATPVLPEAVPGRTAALDNVGKPEDANSDTVAAVARLLERRGQFIRAGRARSDAGAKLVASVRESLAKIAPKLDAPLIDKIRALLAIDDDTTFMAAVNHFYKTRAELLKPHPDLIKLGEEAVGAEIVNGIASAAKQQKENAKA